jgi:hypothetical protein
MSKKMESLLLNGLYGQKLEIEELDSDCDLCITSETETETHTYYISPGKLKIIIEFLREQYDKIQ